MPEGKGKGKGKAAKRGLDVGPIKDFAVEYSKSSRATCKHCDIKICKVSFFFTRFLFATLYQMSKVIYFQ